MKLKWKSITWKSLIQNHYHHLLFGAFINLIFIFNKNVFFSFCLCEFSFPFYHCCRFSRYTYVLFCYLTFKRKASSQFSKSNRSYKKGRKSMCVWSTVVMEFFFCWFFIKFLPFFIQWIFFYILWYFFQSQKRIVQRRIYCVFLFCVLCYVLCVCMCVYCVRESEWVGVADFFIRLLLLILLLYIHSVLYVHKVLFTIK